MSNTAGLKIIRKMRQGYLTGLKQGYAQPAPVPYPPGFQPAPYAPPAREPEKEPPKGVDGIDLSETMSPDEVLPIIKTSESSDLRSIDMNYSLIPRYPKRGERVYAYANIKWNQKIGEPVYYVVEPQITQQDRAIIEKTKRLLEERLDINFFKLGEIKAKSLLREEISKILRSDPKASPGKIDDITYYLERDIVGMGKIEPLVNDPNIEDISCDGINIPIYVYHRDPTIGSLKTSVAFSSEDELNNFVVKMAQRCRKSISIAEPLLDASLPNGSRIQATLGTDIARKGSNFTIRKFAEEPLTPTHMLRYGTLNSTQLAYLWLAIENGQSILISGGTATGKTSMLNALSLFIRPSLKIVSIEDTPELRLPHPHWIPEVARTPLSLKGSSGEVSLFDLLKSSLRQRPDYIVMGEVRGKEAFVLFQQMASIPGEERVFVLNDSNLKRIPISDVDPSKTVGVPTFNPETGRMEIGPFREKVAHLPVTELYKITTKTGREVTTTGNHSVFSQVGAEVVSELREGDDILVPSVMPCGYNDADHFNLMDLSGIRVCCPKLIKRASRILGFDRASEVAGFTTISNYYGVNNCALPVGSFKRLMAEAGIDYAPDEVEVRFGRRSTRMPARLDITPELLRLMGYHISEGGLNKARKNNSISLYNSDSEVLDDMRRCINRVSNSKIRERVTYDFGKSLELSYSNKVIFELLRQQTGDKSSDKRVPDFIFGLSKEKIGHFLSGLYAGDSTMNRDYFGYYTISRQLANDVSLLLLSLGILASIRKRKRAGRNTTDYEVKFYKRRYMDRFMEYVRPVGKGIRSDKKAAREIPDGDVFVDKIRKIERIRLKKPVRVYDLSVPGTQNFVGGFGGVILHNTGHPSLATIHAASINQLVDRLTTPPISLPPSLIENVNIIIFLTLTRLEGKYVRRAEKILEVTGIKDNAPATSTIFSWDPEKDGFKTTENSVVLKNIAGRQAMSDAELKSELARRKSIIEWMQKQDISNYGEVARIISAYYTNPARVMNVIGERF